MDALPGNDRERKGNERMNKCMNAKQSKYIFLRYREANALRHKKKSRTSGAVMSAVTTAVVYMFYLHNALV